MDALISLFSHFVSATTGKTVESLTTLDVALPQYLEALYRPHTLMIEGQALCAIESLTDEPPPPGRLVKQLHRLAAQLNRTPETCCLVANHLDAYSRKRLIELKQPYCLPGQQMYWPALGYIQTRIREKGRPVPLGNHLSPAAQQVLLAILLGRIALPSPVTALAEPLKLSPISASRAAAELTQSELLQAQARGRHRLLGTDQSFRTVWEQAQSVLRTPVMRVVRIREAQKPDAARWLAGESALAAQTMLGDAAIPTYAMAHRDWKVAGRGIEEIAQDDDGLCRIELWRYPPEHLTQVAWVDPLSLALSLRNEDDERVNQAMASLLESTL